MHKNWDIIFGMSVLCNNSENAVTDNEQLLMKHVWFQPLEHLVSLLALRAYCSYVEFRERVGADSF